MPARPEVDVPPVRILVGLLAVLAAACTGSQATADCERIAGVRAGLCPAPVETRSSAPVDRLPRLTVEGLGEQAGTGDVDVSLEDLRGKVVVVNFWASWCGPCRAEQPDLNAAHAAVPADEVVFLGVNIEDSEANALAHLREFDVPYPSVYDPANVYASRFRGVGPRTIPSTIFIDRDGRVAARVFGVISTSEVVGLADAIASER